MTIPADFISFSYIGMIIAAYIVTIIYAINNWKGSLSEKLVTIYLVCYSYGLTTSVIYANGLILTFPHIARTGMLMLLIMNPAIFLSLETAINKRGLLKKDAWHLLPALIYFVNFFTFFVKSSDEKIAILKINEHSLYLEGWFLPKYSVLGIALIQITYYLVIMYKEFIRNKQSDYKPILIKKIKLFWIYTAYHSLVVFFTAYGMYSGEIRGSFHVIYNLGNLAFIYFILSSPGLLYAKVLNENEE
jgi:hypothetical protein